MAQNIFNYQDDIPAGIPLSRFTAAITNAVAMAPGLSGVWITAELSDVRISGGHCYMELIEKNESGQTIAKLRANIWRSTYQLLRQKFFKVTQKEISTGMKALVRGTATHHSLYGLSFNIIDIDPSYTIGDLERLRKEILLKLQKEGIIDNNKKIPLPFPPQKIAVISAEGAAGYGDFINHLTSNSEGFVFYPCLFPCVMQGEKVSESIQEALQAIESMADFWDCVAIVRGGGATTDLNGFDDYYLARAIANCGLPVIVGIGHDRDRNVLDDVAHTSLKTPTAVANFFIDQSRKAYDALLANADKLRIYSTELLRGEDRRLSQINTLMPQLALRRLDESKASLNSFAAKLPIVVESRVGKENIHLQGLNSLFSNLASNRIANQNIKIENIKNLIVAAINNLTIRHIHKIDNLESLTNVLNPINTLKRGYSVTRVNGKAVKSIKEIKKSEVITTFLPDGEFTSTVL